MTERDVTAGADDWRGPWIPTAGGRRLDLVDPLPEQIHIDDIAASLSKLCRWNGHCRPFYSVAQHSLHVARLLPARLALWGLLHDAAEFAVGDMTSPLKRLMPDYAAIEHGFVEAIAARFGLALPMPEAVHHADLVALATETRDLLKLSTPGSVHANDLPPPDEAEIVPVAALEAEVLFLRRFNQIMAAR